MMPAWVLRPGGHDQAVLDAVYSANEYQLPADMTDWSVLDIGACFGAFSRLCAERGAAVVAYEPCPESYSLLVRNTAGLAVARTNAAVAAAAGKASLTRTEDPAGRNVFGVGGGAGDGDEVDVVEFGDAVFWASDRGDGRGVDGPVDLVKIDAEGAEYAIIEGTPADVWQKVRRLAVEFHGSYVPDWEARSEACRRRLAALGFREVAWLETHKGKGWYRLGKWERNTGDFSP